MAFEHNYLKLVYAWWATIYDACLDKFFSFDRQNIVDALDLAPGARVLELGVGTGLNLPYYPADITLVGVDFSAAMLKKAHRKPCKAHLTLLLADAQTLDYPDNYFTHALATFVVRVAVSPQDLLNEVSRVVAPKGRFVVMDQFQNWRFPLSPLKHALGWGQDFQLEQLLKDSPWIIISRKSIATMKNTVVLVLENQKPKD